MRYSSHNNLKSSRSPSESVNPVPRLVCELNDDPISLINALSGHSGSLKLRMT